VPALASVLAFPLAVVCGVAAVATLGLAAARVAGGPDDDMRAAGRGLVRHGAVVIVLLACVMVASAHVATVARVMCALVFATWGAGAILGGVVLSRRPGRSEPPEEEEGGGGGGSGDEPEPPPPWWPQFERDLAAWQRERERVPTPG
jgi:hypothetical protein